MDNDDSNKYSLYVVLANNIFNRFINDMYTCNTYTNCKDDLFIETLKTVLCT